MIIFLGGILVKICYRISVLRVPAEKVTCLGRDQLLGLLGVATLRSAYRAFFSVYGVCFGIKILKLGCIRRWLG